MHVVIGDIARKAITVAPSTKCEKVYAIFEEHPSLEGIVVTVEKKPVGLVMRSLFFQKLSMKYGFDLFMQRPVELVMDKRFLSVDFYVSLTRASSLAMERDQKHLYDYVIVMRDEHLDGVVSIRELIMELSKVQIDIARYSNPLSGLPVNNIIEETLERFLYFNQFSVLYIDLDFFKTFNDTYGFKAGDNLIKETATIITDTIMPFHKEAFVGHIGGDDFIAAIPNFHHEETCQLMISRFNRAILQFYRIEDVERGFIRTLNRKGFHEDIPLVSISIAVIQNKNLSFQTVESLSEIAAKVKSSCKARKGSVFLTLEDVKLEV